MPTAVECFYVLSPRYNLSILLVVINYYIVIFSMKINIPTVTLYAAMCH